MATETDTNKKENAENIGDIIREFLDYSKFANSRVTKALGVSLVVAFAVRGCNEIVNPSEPPAPEFKMECGQSITTSTGQKIEFVCK